MLVDTHITERSSEAVHERINALIQMLPSEKEMKVTIRRSRDVFHDNNDWWESSKQQTRRGEQEEIAGFDYLGCASHRHAMYRCRECGQSVYKHRAKDGLHRCPPHRAGTRTKRLREERVCVVENLLSLEAAAASLLSVK